MLLELTQTASHCNISNDRTYIYEYVWQLINQLNIASEILWDRSSYLHNFNGTVFAQ